MKDNGKPSSARKSPTDIRVAMLKNGYEPLPATAKGVLLKEWTTVAISTKTVHSWREDHPNWVSTGLRTGETIGIDVDITDEEAAGIARTLVFDFFTEPGKLLFRTGRPPKFCVLARCDGSAFAKITVNFEDPSGNKHGVEVLAKGQQFVAHGIHPTTKEPYSWRDDAAPWNVPARNLLAITRDDVCAFIGELVDRLAAKGWKVTTDTRTPAQKTFNRTMWINRPPPSEAELLAMLAVIPSDGSYNEWWKLAGPIYQVLGDEGEEVWMEWCAKGGTSYNEKVARQKWREAPKIHDVTVGTLRYLANLRDSNWADAVAPEDRTLVTDKKKKIVGGPTNIRIGIAKLGVKLSYNEFSKTEIVEGLEGYGPELTDAAVIRLRFLVERKFKFLANKDLFFDALTDIARASSFHPVRDYLDKLEWDGVERIDSWLTTYCGAEQNEYTQAVGWLWLVAAVRRIRQPGCKFDEMLILENDEQQGIGKSVLLSKLALRDEYFYDGLCLTSVTADAKRAIEDLSGKWIIEFAELSGMKRAEIDRIKAFLSRRFDKARLAYGRKTETLARQCVFAGSTNDTRYLRDSTGNRRFWPVRVGRIDVDAVERDRDQLWAEAAAREASGCSIRLEERLWAVAAVEQEERLMDDPWVDILADDVAFDQAKVSASFLFDILGIEASRQTPDLFDRLSKVMRKLGWRRPNKSNMISQGGNKTVGFVIGERPWRDLKDLQLAKKMATNDPSKAFADAKDNTLRVIQGGAAHTPKRRKDK